MAHVYFRRDRVLSGKNEPSGRYEAFRQFNDERYKEKLITQLSLDTAWSDQEISTTLQMLSDGSIFGKDYSRNDTQSQRTLPHPMETSLKEWQLAQQNVFHRALTNSDLVDVSELLPDTPMLSFCKPPGDGVEISWDNAGSQGGDCSKVPPMEDAALFEQAGICCPV